MTELMARSPILPILFVAAVAGIVIFKNSEAIRQRGLAPENKADVVFVVFTVLNTVLLIAEWIAAPFGIIIVAPLFTIPPTFIAVFVLNIVTHGQLDKLKWYIPCFASMGLSVIGTAVTLTLMGEAL